MRCIAATTMVKKIVMCVFHTNRMGFTMFLIGSSKLSRLQMILAYKRYELQATKGANNMVVLVPRKVTEHRKCLGRLLTRDMKNFVRRWWKSHDIPEFERIIVAGTMQCIHMVSKRKSVPICDYYVVGGS